MYSSINILSLSNHSDYHNFNIVLSSVCVTGKYSEILLMFTDVTGKSALICKLAIQI